MMARAVEKNHSRKRVGRELTQGGGRLGRSSDTFVPRNQAAASEAASAPRDGPHSPSQGKSNLFSLGDNRGGHNAGSSNSHGWAPGSHSAAGPSLPGDSDTRATVLASGPGRGLWSGAGGHPWIVDHPSPVTVSLLLVRDAAGRRGSAMMCPVGFPHCVREFAQTPAFHARFSRCL